jgi:multisubunit Na+/H+ antiporter MnhC subunit
VSTGNKFWTVNDGSTTDAVHTFTDTTYKTPVSLNVPADVAVVTTNPVTGRAEDVAFTWARLGVTAPTFTSSGAPITLGNLYRIEIALDSAFTQIVKDLVQTVPNVSDPVVVLIGPNQPTETNYPFAPGTTYYWRVRAIAPLESPVSVTRSFKFSSLAAPFAIQGPAVGATNIPIKPILSWTAYEGALWYELTVSEDPTFAIPEFSHNVGAGIKPPTTFYGVTETLKYDTTYYWRVRGVTAEPFVKGTTVVTPAGPWQTGAFTTMADPAKAPGATAPTTPGTPTAPPTINVQPAPVTVNPTPVQTQVVEVIPQWMLLTVIVIGAVLIIALVVLIVRTRKAA